MARGQQPRGLGDHTTPAVVGSVLDLRAAAGVKSCGKRVAVPLKVMSA